MRTLPKAPRYNPDVVVAYRFSDARKLLFREWPRSFKGKDSEFGFEVWEIADNQIETCVLGEMIWFAEKSFHGNKKPGVVLHAVWVTTIFFTAFLKKKIPISILVARIF